MGRHNKRTKRFGAGLEGKEARPGPGGERMGVGGGCGHIVRGAMNGTKEKNTGQAVRGLCTRKRIHSTLPL